MLHQCRKRSPVFTHSLPPSSSSSSSSSSFPTNPSLPFLCLPLAFPQINTQPRFITIHQVSLRHASLLCSLQLCRERRGRGGQGEGAEGKSKRHLMIEKNKSPLCFLCPDVCTNIYYQTAACMSSSLFCLWQKNLQGNKAGSVLNTEICFLLCCFEFITCLSLNPLRSYTLSQHSNYYLCWYTDKAFHPWKWAQCLISIPVLAQSKLSIV